MNFTGAGYRGAVVPDGAFAREWLGDDSGYEVLDVSLLTDAVEVRLAGTGDLPQVNDLSAQVNETAGREVELVVKVIEQRTLVPEAMASTGAATESIALV